MKSRNIWKNEKEKRKSIEGFLFAVAILVGTFHCWKRFGEVVAALVAGDRLPPIYPVMTMGVLRSGVGEVGGKNKESGDRVREV